jgi:hypothetical protein
MKNFAIVGLRLLAVWAFIKATVYTQYLPSYFILEDDFLTATGIGILITFLQYLVISIILFYKAPAFAEKMTSDLGEEEVPSFDHQILAAVLFSSAGLLIFFWAIESFIQSIGSLYHYRVMDPQNPDRIWREIRLLVFGGGIQIIVGIVLFTGGKKLSGWWVNFRDWT